MSHEYFFRAEYLAILALSVSGFIVHAIYNRKRLAKVGRETIRDLSQLYAILHRVINRTSANRCLVWAIHNGGKALSVHSTRFVTILEEANAKEAPHGIKSDYDRFKVDSEFIRLVNQMIDSGSILMDINELRPSILKQLLTKDGVKQAYFYYIGWHKGSHYFGSFSTSTEGGFYAENEYVELLIGSQKVRRIYSKPLIGVGLF